MVCTSETLASDKAVEIRIEKELEQIIVLVD